jgi:5-methylcytosine-specific restriction endonuclease McrA
MADRICLWCGTTIEHKRSNARYCCTQHQKNAGSRAHRARNPGYYAKYSKSPARLKYAEDNKEARRSYARDHYWKQDRAEIAKRTRAYRQANAEYFRLKCHERRSLRRNNPDSVGVSQRDWIRLCRRYDYLCAYCGAKPKKLTVDHIIPLSKGGRDAIGNVLPACSRCNNMKRSVLLIVWRYRRGEFD